MGADLKFQPEITENDFVAPTKADSEPQPASMLAPALTATGEQRVDNRGMWQRYKMPIIIGTGIAGAGIGFWVAYNKFKSNKNKVSVPQI